MNQLLVLIIKIYSFLAALGTPGTSEAQQTMSGMRSFFLGVLSSLIAMVLGVIGIRYLRPSILKRISSAFFGHGIEFLYDSQANAEKHMIKTLRKSAFIDVLCMRAFSITRPDRPFHFVLRDMNKHTRVLISDPGDNPSDNPEIAERAKLYPSCPNTETYRSDVYSAVQAVMYAKSENPNVECKLHRMPACHRLYIADSRAFVSFFVPGSSGAQLPIMSVLKRSPLYTGMRIYFDGLWKYARNAEELKYSPKVKADD